jgi:hypothetical protein
VRDNHLGAERLDVQEIANLAPVHRREHHLALPMQWDAWQAGAEQESAAALVDEQHYRVATDSALQDVEAQVNEVWAQAVPEPLVVLQREVPILVSQQPAEQPLLAAQLGAVVELARQQVAPGVQQEKQVCLARSPEARLAVPPLQPGVALQVVQPVALRQAEQQQPQEPEVAQLWVSVQARQLREVLWPPEPAGAAERLRRLRVSDGQLWQQLPWPTSRPRPSLLPRLRPQPIAENGCELSQRRPDL